MFGCYLTGGRLKVLSLCYGGQGNLFFRGNNLEAAFNCFSIIHFGYYCSPDDSVRRFRRDHTPEEAVTEDRHQEELEEEQEKEQEDKREHESCVVEASLPDLQPASWQQAVLLPDLLDLGSDARDGGGCRENNGSTGSTGRVKNVNKRVF